MPINERKPKYYAMAVSPARRSSRRAPSHDSITPKLSRQSSVRSTVAAKGDVKPPQKSTAAKTGSRSYAPSADSDVNSANIKREASPPSPDPRLKHRFRDADYHKDDLEYIIKIEKHKAEIEEYRAKESEHLQRAAELQLELQRRNRERAQN